MTEVDFDNLEGNAHLILYYLVKIFPELKEKNEIAQATGLHSNTIYNKLKFLHERKLAGKKQIGRQTYYFLKQDIKKIFDEWMKTPIGKIMIEEFENRLKTKN
ncbi:MAG: hypothetical protein ACE5OZ_14965 [Candidatus Heimdallarchaeota archaeon]